MTSKVELDNGRVVLYLGDCLEVMPTLPEKSIDLILADLPYG
jgi:DNA modification methylase